VLGEEWDNRCQFGAPPAWLACEVCGRQFPKAYQLEIHRLTVAGSRHCRAS
jgi:hypothetical protein